MPHKLSLAALLFVSSAILIAGMPSGWAEDGPAATFVISGMNPQPSSLIPVAPSTVVITCNKTVNPATVTSDTVKLVAAGADGVFDTSDDVRLVPKSLSVSGTTIQIGIPTQTTVRERYRITLVSTGSAMTPSTSYLPTMQPVDVTVGDVNRDGKLDIIVANTQQLDPTVFLGNGSGGFGSPINLPWPPGQVHCIALADFNQDGMLDITGNATGPSVPILRNTGQAGGNVSFAPLASFMMGNTNNWVRTADVNGDGRPDLLSCYPNLSVSLNTTSVGASVLTFGPYKAFPVDTAQPPWMLSTGDINGDGKPDVITCHREGSNICAMLNLTPTGATVPAFSAAFSFNTGAYAKFVELADINGDGKPDAIVASSETDCIQVLINTTPTGALVPSFNPPVNFPAAGGPCYVSIADMNGDGKLDIVSAQGRSGESAVLINTTAAGSTIPTFAAAVKYATGPMPAAVWAGDLTGKGQVSIVSVIPMINCVSVFYPATSIQDSTGKNLDGEFITGFPSGDGQAGGSFSATFDVGPSGVTQTSVSVSPSFANYGDASVALAATVTAASGQLINSGNVTFQVMSNGANVGAAVASTSISNGAASVGYAIPAGTPAGTYTVVATYGATSAFAASTDNTQQLVIQKAPLTVVPDNSTRTYGAANPLLSGRIIGIKYNDAISATYSTNATLLDNAGPYEVLATLADPDGKLVNYTPTFSHGTLTVARAVLTAVANNATRAYGGNNPALSGTVAGMVNGDSVQVVFDTQATPASPASTYTITARFADPAAAANYTLVTTSGLLTVTRAPLSVTPADASRPYHAADPSFTGTITGLINNDAVTATYSTNAGRNSAVGAYSITPVLNGAAGVLNNYSVSSRNGTLTITKAVPSIVWPSPGHVAAGAALTSQQLNATARDPYTGDAVSGSFTYSPAGGALLASGLGRPLSAAFAPADAANYVAAVGQTTVDVDAAVAPAITSVLSATIAKDAAFAYRITATGTAPVTFDATNLPAGVTFSGDALAGTPITAGIFPITLTAINSAGTDTKTLQLTVLSPATNHPPALSSPPTASVNPATVGAPVTISTLATDADGDALHYIWEFGDGTVGSGASVSKTFTAAGAYTVKLVVTDGQSSVSQSLNMVVNALAVSQPFALDRVDVAFNFVRRNHSLVVSGTIPLQTDFTPAGTTVRITVGALDKSYTLTPKGTSTDKALVLKAARGSATGTFKLTVKDPALYSKLEGLGFSQTESNPNLNFPVSMAVDGASFGVQPVIHYTAKVNKSGPVSGRARN